MALPITVFTPTYNRAHTLDRLHASLLQQKADLFEWLVVDDGSTDSTPELLEKLTKASPFSVRVIRQPNGGKHVAHNRAVAAATGQLTIVLDSDDELLPDAVENLWKAWMTIPESERSGYAGIIGNSVDEGGTIAGKPFPRDVLDAHWIEMAASGKHIGDKLPCYRTDLLREFPFPGEAQKDLVPEGTVWCQLGQRYWIRYVNISVLLVHHDPTDKHSMMARARTTGAAAYGQRAYALVVIEHASRNIRRWPLFFARHAVLIVKSSFHLEIGVSDQFRALPGLVARLLWLLALPIGYVRWVVEKRRLPLATNRAKS